MGDDWLTTEELLERVPLEGERPDAVLKRLRRAGILKRPKRDPRGYGRGVGQLNPPGTEDRLRRVRELRAKGVRSLKEVRWWLWFDGADDLWPPVQQDLVAAYPYEEEAAFLQLRAEDDEGLADEVEYAATETAEAWHESHHRAFDGYAVRGETERRNVALVVGESAVGWAPSLDEPFDDAPDGSDRDGSGSETVRALVDRAWGSGSADTLEDLAQAGALDLTHWIDALRSGTVQEARVVADLWHRNFTHDQARSELEFFGRDWGDRALLVASQLSAVHLGLAPPPM